MYLLRHGQSFFNLHFNSSRIDPGIEDPELTDLGHEQARAAAEKLAECGVKRIIVSPYSRALQTAAPIASKFGIVPQVMQEVRERTAFSCDIGKSPAALSTLFPSLAFAHLPNRWWHHAEEPEHEVVARADDFRALMATSPDSEATLLVSHWAFILALSGVSVRNGELLQYDPTVGAPALIDWDY